MKKDKKNKKIVTQFHKDDPLTAYYNRVIKKARKLMEESDFRQALNIIKDELETPYIPSTFLEELEKLALDLETEINYVKSASEFENVSRDQMIYKIIDQNGVLNTSAFLIFLGRYASDLTPEEIKKIEAILVSKKTSNIHKIYILENFRAHRLIYDFDFYNSQSKQSFRINTMDVNIFEESAYYNEINSLIDEFTYKEPSLQHFCQSLLTMIYLYCFPKTPEFEPKELSLGIFQYMVDSLQGGEGEKIKKEIYEFIKKVFNSDKEIAIKS
ncbi:MAG: DUF3196 family protein [Malacoplasma sp.]|nr:DUF3196 family protein [Malacoplasma sp.]